MFGGAPASGIAPSSAGPALAGLAGVSGAMVDNALGNVSFFAGPRSLGLWTLGESVSDLHRDWRIASANPPVRGVAVLFLGLATGVLAMAVLRFAADVAHFSGRRALESATPPGGPRV